VCGCVCVCMWMGVCVGVCVCVCVFFPLTEENELALNAAITYSQIYNV